MNIRLIYMRKAFFLLFAGVVASFHAQAAKRPLCGAKVCRRANSRFCSKYLYTMPSAASQRRPAFLPYLSSLHKQRQQYQGQDFKKHRSFFPYLTIGIAGITAGSLYQNTEAQCICCDKERLLSTYDKTFECKDSFIGIVKKRIEKTLEISRAFRNSYDDLKYPEVAGMGLLTELQWCLDIKMACVCDRTGMYDSLCWTCETFISLCKENNYDARIEKEIRRLRNLISSEKPNGSIISKPTSLAISFMAIPAVCIGAVSMPVLGLVTALVGSGMTGTAGLCWLSNTARASRNKEAARYLKLYRKVVHPNASPFWDGNRVREEAIAASIAAHSFCRAWEASGNAGVAKTYNKDMEEILALGKKQQH